MILERPSARLFLVLASALVDVAFWLAGIGEKLFKTSSVPTTVSKLDSNGSNDITEDRIFIYRHLAAAAA